MELEKTLKSEAASVSWQDFQAVMEITILNDRKVVGFFLLEAATTHRRGSFTKG